jgi:hypothetical protein
MSKNQTQYKHKENNPANQPFNVKARHNLTKKKSWWSNGGKKAKKSS